jgi:hypothetical protein
MEKAILLAIAARFCTATASVCLRPAPADPLPARGRFPVPGGGSGRRLPGYRSCDRHINRALPAVITNCVGLSYSDRENPPPQAGMV